MKVLPSLLAGGLLVATGLSATQNPPQGDPLEPRVAALEQEVQALKQENTEIRGLLEQTVTYLQGQAKASEAMLGTLDASEKEGFTAGINFRSREILLAGFRAYWNAEKSGVPQMKSKETAEKPAGRGGRQVPQRDGGR